MLGLMPCHHLLNTLYAFEQGALHFHVVLGPPQCEAGPGGGQRG